MPSGSTLSCGQGHYSQLMQKIIIVTICTVWINVHCMEETKRSWQVSVSGTGENVLETRNWCRSFVICYLKQMQLSSSPRFNVILWVCAFVCVFKSSIIGCEATQWLGTEYRLNSVYKARGRFIRQVINLGMWWLLAVNLGCLSNVYAYI